MSNKWRTTKTRPVRVTLTRPDGTQRELSINGHFREELLCSVIEEEIRERQSPKPIVVRLQKPDPRLVSSLRRRWREGLSDEQPLAVQEVLGPSGDAQQIVIQLLDVRERIRTGEEVCLAIRSSKVARYASPILTKMLKSSQRSEAGQFSLFVHGSREEQLEIMQYLPGLARVRDLQDSSRWKGPYIMEETTSKRRGKRRKSQVSEKSVDAWIRRVEKRRRFADPEDDENDSDLRDAPTEA